MKLKSEIAECLVHEAFDEKDGWAYVTQIDGDDRRWSRTITTVVKSPEGAHYAFYWEQGLTESQENRYPWGARYDKNPPEEIDIYKVKPVEVTTISWVRA